MKTIDLLSRRKVTEVYMEEVRFAVNKDFFCAFGTFNPPHQQLANGYRLFLKNGERVDVAGSFRVEVFEAPFTARPLIR